MNPASGAMVVLLASGASPRSTPRSVGVLGAPRPAPWSSGLDEVCSAPSVTSGVPLLIRGRAGVI